jgi:hypothetical protein
MVSNSSSLCQKAQQQQLSAEPFNSRNRQRDNKETLKQLPCWELTPEAAQRLSGDVNQQPHPHTLWHTHTHTETHTHTPLVAHTVLHWQACTHTHTPARPSPYLSL